jgi:hypothetical protein
MPDKAISSSMWTICLVHIEIAGLFSIVYNNQQEHVVIVPAFIEQL